MEYVRIVSLNAIVLTLIVSGLAKLFDIKTNIRLFEKLSILPSLFNKIVGASLPYFEIGIALMLLSGYFEDTVNILLVILIFSFIVVNIMVILRNEDIACGCFGRFFKGKMGRGGLFHSLILLVYCTPLLFTNHLSLVELVYEHSLQQIILLILCSFGLFLTGMFSRLSDIS